MAKQIITKLLDDLDGGDADETVRFALDGVGYEIDLASKNAKKLRDFLDPYIQASTSTGRVGSGPPVQRQRTVAPRAETIADARATNQAVRDWAQQKGLNLSDRGRIPQHIRDAYHEQANAQAVVGAVKKAAGVTEVSFRPGRRSA